MSSDLRSIPVNPPRVLSDPVALPDSVRAAIAGYAYTPVSIGESGGAVYRLDAPGRPALFLKHGTGRIARDISAEMARLEWLAGRLPVPGVHHFVQTPGEACLVTLAVPGQGAYDYLVEHPSHRIETVAALARTLRALHALPLADCPFHAGHELRMADARRNIDAGLVDADDFDEEREGWTPEEVWAELTRLQPIAFDRVVTHGDFSLDNIRVHDGRVTGCIDVGRAGAADPYQDLAILWNSLEEFGPDAKRAMWQAYGITEPDERKLRFHLCLDELF